MLRLHWIKRIPGSAIHRVVEKITLGHMTVGDAVIYGKSLWVTYCEMLPELDGFQVVDNSGVLLRTMFKEDMV